MTEYHMADSTPGFEEPGVEFVASLSPEALGAPESGIVEVFNYGRGRQGLIPLWIGEGDAPTPAFIREALAASLAAGETFYTHQRGIPELREAIAAYLAAHYGGPFADKASRFDAERVFVTSGGMHALQVALRLVCGAGDEAIVPTPAWPNFVGALAAAGARAVELPMRLAEAGGVLRWSLDMGRLADAITPRTRALIVNSPGNPTGWTATLPEMAEILALARHRGLWIIADEIYGRMCFDAVRAPSFHDLIDANDRVMFVQTFSKNWAMTGLRCGWLEAPPQLGAMIENLIQYSSSGTPVPVQRAAVAALEQGEPFVAQQLAGFRANRDILCGALAATGRARFAFPEAAFYLFASFDGVADTRKMALQWVDEAHIGAAPGAAFGAGGDGYVRLCFAPDTGLIREAARRLAQWLAR